MPIAKIDWSRDLSKVGNGRIPLCPPITILVREVVYY